MRATYSGDMTTIWVVDFDLEHLTDFKLDLVFTDSSEFVDIGVIQVSLRVYSCKQEGENEDISLMC